MENSRKIKKVLQEKEAFIELERDSFIKVYFGCSTYLAIKEWNKFAEYEQAFARKECQNLSQPESIFEVIATDSTLTVA